VIFRFFPEMHVFIILPGNDDQKRLGAPSLCLLHAVMAVALQGNITSVMFNDE